MSPHIRLFYLVRERDKFPDLYNIDGSKVKDYKLKKRQLLAGIPLFSPTMSSGPSHSSKSQSNDIFSDDAEATPEVGSNCAASDIVEDDMGDLESEEWSPEGMDSTPTRNPFVPSEPVAPKPKHTRPPPPPPLPDFSPEEIYERQLGMYERGRALIKAF
ncbi:hypothetical protein VNI00_000076 [Paramarasmius palmivorus]|uniref:Uncharacterized protein n=1 Tax=Paramarasmius palmivorus TaxID=297713 RepID=A0AAW0EGQ5_9AGAR